MIKPHSIKPIIVELESEDTEKIAFYPRMAFKSERDEFAKRLAEIGAETIGRGERIFEIQREAVAAWSIKPPELVEKIKGENKLSPLVADVTNAPDAINQFFAKFTVEHEEIISTAYSAFLNLMSGKASFLLPSV